MGLLIRNPLLTPQAPASASPTHPWGTPWSRNSSSASSNYPDQVAHSPTARVHDGCGASHAKQHFATESSMSASHQDSVLGRMLLEVAIAFASVLVLVTFFGWLAGVIEGMR